MTIGSALEEYCKNSNYIIMLGVKDIYVIEKLRIYYCIFSLWVLVIAIYH